MRRRAPLVMLLAAAIASLSACQDPDVGQACPLSWGQDNATPAPTPVDLYSSGSGDYFESGNLACDGLVCIVSPIAPGGRYACNTPGCGYCSKACISNDDCFSKQTGLVCRQMVLDDAFIALLNKTPEGQQTLARYLSDIQSSSYCATPR